MMKTAMAVVAALGLVVTAFAGTEVCIKVDGMTCGGCEGKVKKAVAKMDGVKLTEVSAKKGMAKLTLEDAASKADVMAAINKTGLKAVGERVTYQVEGMSCGACEGKVEKALAKLDGVKTEKVCAKSGTATVVIDCEGKTCTNGVAKAIAATGFKVK